MDLVVFLINFIFSVLYLILVVRAVLPWLPHNESNLFLRPVYAMTDPVLSVIRNGLPPERIGMDVSPYIVIILLWIVHQVIMRFLP